MEMLFIILRRYKENYTFDIMIKQRNNSQKLTFKQEMFVDWAALIHNDAKSIISI